MDLVHDISKYFLTSSHKFVGLLYEHIFISLLATLFATVIAIPLGILCSKNNFLKKWSVKLFNILRIIPSLAILLILLPILGTGTLPALIALIILGIPPILLNTIVGINEIPKDIIEAGVGIGMNRQQVLAKIELSLAVPSLLIGVRISLIEIIASATLAAKIGAGGLGELIFTGIGLNKVELILIGGFVIGFIAILCSLLLGLIEKRVAKYKYI